MSKPRKKYRPRAKTFNPLAALQPIPADKIQADMDRNLLALDAMATQVGCTEDQWIELSDVVNTVEMLIEMGEIDVEHAEVTQAAIGAMVACAHRHRDHGEPFRMTPAEVETMREVLTLYQVCLERKPWMVIYRAQKACTQRINKQLGEARQKGPQ